MRGEGRGAVREGLVVREVRADVSEEVHARVVRVAGQRDLGLSKSGKLSRLSDSESQTFQMHEQRALIEM